METRGIYHHAQSHFWPMLCSKRLRYSDRAVTYSNKKVVFISFWNYTILIVITQKITFNTSLEPFFTWGPLTFCTINDVVERVLLVVCMCECICVHVLGRKRGRGECMLSMPASATGSLYSMCSNLHPDNDRYCHHHIHCDIHDC